MINWKFCLNYITIKKLKEINVQFKELNLISSIYL